MRNVSGGTDTGTATGRGVAAGPDQGHGPGRGADAGPDPATATTGHTPDQGHVTVGKLAAVVDDQQPNNDSSELIWLHRTYVGNMVLSLCN